MKNLVTTIIAGSQYLLHPQKLGTIQETIKPDALIPITLLTTEEIFGDHLEATLEHFASYDDVFTPTFGDVLVEKTSTNGTNSTSSRITSARHMYHLHSQQLAALDQIGELPSGPYMLHGPNVYQAWKLYQDELDAFTFGVIPEDVNARNKYEALSSLTEDGEYKAIGVPSRLYYPPPSPNKPLSGVRIAITDSISIKGVDTTLSSKAYRETYPDASNDTADLASQLINLGAVLVGKTKTSSLLTGQEWEDEQKPWNPRGDSYQNPSVNAAGAGSSLAGYPWVERVISQSSLEGFFDLAGPNGLHSLRPTFNDSTLEGVQVSSPKMDTMNLHARSIDDLKTLAAALLGSSAAPLPKRIIYLTDLSHLPTTEEQSLLDKFVASLEKPIGLKAEHVDMAKLWSQHPPKEGKDQSLRKYLGKAAFAAYSYEYYHAFDGFRKKFEDQHQESPFLEPTTKYRWEVGMNVTETQYKGYLQRQEVFKAWFDKNIMNTTDTGTIMVLPCQFPLSYRNEEPEPPSPLESVSPETLSAVLGTPIIASPFGQISYTSKITNKTAYRPVCGALMGPRDGDMGLIQVMKQVFETSKWRATVTVGETAFPVESSERGWGRTETKSDSIKSREELR